MKPGYRGARCRPGGLRIPPLRERREEPGAREAFVGQKAPGQLGLNSTRVWIWLNRERPDVLAVEDGQSASSEARCVLGRIQFPAETGVPSAGIAEARERVRDPAQPLEIGGAAHVGDPP